MNFRVQLISLATGEVILSYPDKFRFDNGEGIDLMGAGTHFIDLYYIDGATPTRILNGETFRTEGFWNSSPGTLLGVEFISALPGGGIPYLELDFQEFEFAELVTENDEALIKTMYESNADTNAFTDIEKTKLNNIEGGAEVNVQSDWNQSNASEDDYIKNKPASGTGDMEKSVYDPNLVEEDAFDMENMVEGTNNKIFSDTERTKLGGIEAGAEVNPSDAEIKTAYENNADTNAFTDTEKTKLGNQSGSNSGDVTLEAGDTTQETLDLTGQEVKVNLVTQSTDGAMSAEDKLKIDNILDNGGGDDWISGLSVSEHSPKNQTVDYTSGTYLIDGVVKTIASGGTYDLENGYLGVDHYAGFVNYQHALVAIYVDVDEVIKSIAGPTAEKKDSADLPLLPADSVCIAVLEIKVDKNDNPKDIRDKDIEDCRTAGRFSTDELVKASADDASTGYLIDKLSNNGNVEFTIENPTLDETIKADVDIANDSAVQANTAKVSNVQADWDEANSGAESYINNKPSFGTSEYGELYMVARGNQSVGSPTKIVWNTAGVSNGTTLSTSNNRITALSDGVYKIEFTGSALIKRNETYSLFIYVNGSQAADLGERYTTIDNTIITLGFSRLLSLSANDYVEIYGECTGTKDFDLSPGAAFNIVKL
jgi:hypothetical protein